MIENKNTKDLFGNLKDSLQKQIKDNENKFKQK
jgi:hypothetical protein